MFGRAIVPALPPLPIRVRWIDSRPDQFPPLSPENVRAAQLLIRRQHVPARCRTSSVVRRETPTV
jgi:hypothetical protein